MLPWFRMYAEAVDDDKLRLLAFEDRWHFVALLCLKAQGILDERNDALRRQKIGVKLGLDSVELETVMKRLVTVGLVTSRWQPMKWSKRQYQSDSSTSRVRAFRERSRNVSVTPSDTDTDTDTEKEAPPALVVPDGFARREWEEWLAHRRKKRYPLDDLTLRKQVEFLAGYDAATQREILNTSIRSGWQGVFPPKNAKPQLVAKDDSAEWTKLKARAKASGFRDPWPVETPAIYETSLRDYEREKRRA